MSSIIYAASWNDWWLYVPLDTKVGHFRDVLTCTAIKINRVNYMRCTISIYDTVETGSPCQQFWTGRVGSGHWVVGQWVNPQFVPVLSYNAHIYRITVGNFYVRGLQLTWYFCSTFYLANLLSPGISAAVTPEKILDFHVIQLYRVVESPGQEPPVWVELKVYTRFLVCDMMGGDYKH